MDKKQNEIRLTRLDDDLFKWISKRAENNCRPNNKEAEYLLKWIKENLSEQLEKSEIINLKTK